MDHRRFKIGLLVNPQTGVTYLEEEGRKAPKHSPIRSRGKRSTRGSTESSAQTCFLLPAGSACASGHRKRSTQCVLFQGTRTMLGCARTAKAGSVNHACTSTTSVFVGPLQGRLENTQGRSCTTKRHKRPLNCSTIARSQRRWDVDCCQEAPVKTEESTPMMPNGPSKLIQAKNVSSVR